MPHPLRCAYRPALKRRHMTSTGRKCWTRQLRSAYLHISAVGDGGSGFSEPVLLNIMVQPGSPREVGPQAFIELNRSWAGTRSQAIVTSDADWPRCFLLNPRVAVNAIFASNSRGKGSDVRAAQGANSHYRGSSLVPSRESEWDTNRTELGVSRTRLSDSQVCSLFYR